MRPNAAYPPASGIRAHRSVAVSRKALLTATLAAISVLAAPGQAVRADALSPSVSQCVCPLGSGSWLLFEDSNAHPNVPDFWDEPYVQVDELSVCDHGVAFFFTSEQDGNLYVTALFFEVPTAELVRTRLRIRESSPRFGEKLEQLTGRYAALQGFVEAHLGHLMDEHGRVIFRQMDTERPRIPRPRLGLDFVWGDVRFELRGYLDVYFTPML